MDKIKVALVQYNAVQQQHKRGSQSEQQLNTSLKWYLGQSCCVGLHQVQWCKHVSLAVSDVVFCTVSWGIYAKFMWQSSIVRSLIFSFAG